MAGYSDTDARAYLNALQNEAAHTAPSPTVGPNGSAPPPPPPPTAAGYTAGPAGYATSAVAAGAGARDYAIAAAPAAAQPLLGQLRPFLLPIVTGGVVYYLTESKVWTAGLALATLLLQGSYAPAAAAPPPIPGPVYR